MKRLVSLLLVFAFVFSLMAGMEITSNAGTNGHTQVEAISWLNDRLGTQVGDGQCPALAREYYAYLGYSVSGDGKDYEYNVPSGWTITYYSSGFIPQPGDVAVWRKTNSTAGAKHGHVAIVASATSSGMVCYEQGDSASNKVRKYDWGYSSVTGFIHPDFAPATTPIVYANNSKYAIGSTVIFTFSAPGATSVYFGLYLDGQMYFNGEFGPESTYSRTLTQTGHYAFYIVAHCPGGDIDSEWSDFDVYNDLSAFIPQKPYLATNSQRYFLGESIEVSHWSELAQYYSVSLYENNALLFNEFSSVGTQLITVDHAGSFTLVVSAVNQYGESECARCSFTVIAEKAKQPVLYTDLTLYQLGSNIQVFHWSENAQYYSLSLYKDEELISNEYSYSGSDFYTIIDPGNYKFVASAINSFGESEYAQTSFTVYNADVNGNKIIDINDIVQILSSNNYGFRKSESVNESCDINLDGVIDMADITVILSTNFYGKSI